MSIAEPDTLDITPDIEWAPRLSATDLLTVMSDDRSEAQLWREIALAAITQLHKSLAQHEQLRTALREVVAEIEAREQGHAT